MKTYQSCKKTLLKRSLSQAKLMSTTALVAASLIGMNIPSAQATGPSWGELATEFGGFTTDTTTPNVTNITLTTGRAGGIGDADIHLGDTVNVNGALFVVRDNKADPTQILGALNSNGQIIIIDNNGIFFGKDSVVDVGSIIATTGNITTADLNDGDGRFTIDSSGSGESIDIRGSITVAEAGLAAFVSPFVSNSGIINARMGTVAFAAGNIVTLDMFGDGLYEVAVDGALADALLENTATGEINAEGGVVQMTARAVKDVADNIINVEGVVSASSATVQGGKIILSGGNHGAVRVAGTLDASGTDGGEISVTGETVEIMATAELLADGRGSIESAPPEGAPSPEARSSELTPAGPPLGGTSLSGGLSVGVSRVLLVGAPLPAATLPGDGGDVYVNSTSSTVFLGRVSSEATGGGIGGAVEISGAELYLGGTLNVSAGGSVIFDPVTFTIEAAEAGTIVSAMSGGAAVSVAAEETITVNAAIDSSAQVNAATLTFVDQDADGDLTVNLNENITLGAGQALAGEATLVNVIEAAEIQDGIDVAAMGATVNVEAGTYNEAVVVDVEGLILNGANAGTVGTDPRAAEAIIDSGAAVGVSVLADDVTVDGFTINSDDNAIDVLGSDGVNILNNIVTSALATGINVYNSDNARITGNSILGADIDGIYAFGSDELLIGYNNIVNVGQDGIEVRRADGFTIAGNIIDNSSAGRTGILVRNASNGLIGGSEEDGNVILANRDAIRLDEVSGVEISWNDIDTVSEEGIDLDNSDNIDIVSNIIHDVGEDGIEIDDSADILIADNIFTDIGDDGIEIDNSSNIEISGNMMSNTGGQGIDVNDNVGTLDIEDNLLGDMATEGIKIENSEMATIAGNNINVTGTSGFSDGILIKKTDDVVIEDNIISETSGEGIQLESSDGALIDGNVIVYAGADGIDSDDSDNLTISNNFIYGSDDDGIDIDTGENVQISDNIIEFSDGDGIDADDVLGLDVTDNQIAWSGYDGVDVDSSSNVYIAGNDVVYSGDNGVEIDDSNNVEIDDNIINYAENDGIHVGDIFTEYAEIGEPDYALNITNNDINMVGDDGIDVRDSGRTRIAGNDIRYTGVIGTEEVSYTGASYEFRGEIFEGETSEEHLHFDGGDYNGGDGIFVDNVSAGEALEYEYDTAYSIFETTPPSSEYDIEIVDNIIGDTADDGIDVRAATGLETNILVDLNEITNAAGNGILLSASGFYGKGYKGEFRYKGSKTILNSDIFDNRVENSGQNGLNVEGNGHGDVVLAGNTFIDNPTGARFESGRVDLSDRSNPNNFVIRPDYILPKGREFRGRDFVTGLKFELSEAAEPTDLTIVGETLGATQFGGFISRDVDRAFYARFEDGAILDNIGDVIEIDGTFASFDGVVPNSLGNALPPAVLSAIEDRLFDADDASIDGRGQIFVGVPAEEASTIDNIEDFFNQFTPFSAGPSGLDVLVTGLPSVGGTPSLESLPDIEPAAGEEEEDDDVANIEPAAGDSGEESGDASCWGDAIGAAGEGTSTSYSFGGSFEESLADAANCASKKL